MQLENLEKKHMGTNEFDLYMGMPHTLNNQTQQQLLTVVKTRYPDIRLEEIQEGYWSGVEEDALLFKVHTTEKHLLQTIEMLKTIQPDLFVAFSDGDNV